MREHPQPKDSNFIVRGLIAIRSIYNWVVWLISSLIELVFTIAFTSVVLACMLLGVVFIRAIVISFTWGWFITPIFAIRAITVYEAVGLSIFASAILPPRSGQKPESDFAKQHPALSLTVAAVSEVFIAPAILLAVAWGLAYLFQKHFLNGCAGGLSCEARSRFASPPCGFNP